MSEFAFTLTPAKIWKESGNTFQLIADAADRVRGEIYDAIQSLVPFPYDAHRRPHLATLCASQSCATT